MSETNTLEREGHAEASGEHQDLRYAIDAGAYTFVGARLKLIRFEGTPTSGTVKVALYQALKNEAGEYGLVKDTSGATELEFTIDYSDSEGTVYFKTSKHFTRYLIWEVTDFGLGGATGLTFSIELILK